MCKSSAYQEMKTSNVYIIIYGVYTTYNSNNFDDEKSLPSFTQLLLKDLAVYVNKETVYLNLLGFCQQVIRLVQNDLFRKNQERGHLKTET